MNEDSELLRRYAANRDEEAFAELVRRHLNFVYSAALRQVNGDAHLAADVTQIVFTDLARKASGLTQHRTLAGWLFTSTRFTAAKLIRTERRRHTREQEAHVMQELQHEDGLALDWQRASPVLDEALAQLGADDRDAVLLRFFEGRAFADIGARFRLSENAARMRVDRALEKLRAQLQRRGLTSTSAALAAALANQGMVAAPVALGSTVTTAALAGGGSVAGGMIAFMSMNKLPAGIAAVIALAGGAGVMIQADANAQLREEIASLRQQIETTAELRESNERLARVAAEADELRGDDAEFARLAAQAEALRTRSQTMSPTTAGSNSSMSAVTGPVLPISELDVAPRPTLQSQPIYPFNLRRMGISGQVVVGMVVDQNGNTAQVTALSSKLEGEPELQNGDVDPETVAITAEIRAEFEAAAVAAVSKWRFQAGQKDGVPVNTKLSVPIIFKIMDGRSSEEEKRKQAEVRWF